MPLPWHSDDRLIWLSLFTATFAVTYFCIDALTTLTTATETIEPAKQFCVVNQETEDQVQESDLLVLSSHPVRQIREAAIKILVTRAAHDEKVKKLIEADVCSEDEKLARRATQGMRLIQRYEPDTFDLPFRRRAGQRPREQIDDGVESILGDLLGTIERATEDTEGNYVDEFDDFLRMEDDGSRTNIFGEPVVRGGAVREREMARLADLLAADEVDDENMIPRSRERDGSPSEQARRRRRREAIVLHEGNQPLTEGDIIHRRRTDL